MKALLTVVIASVLLGGVFVNGAEAGDKRGKHNKRVDARHYRDYDNDDFRRYRGNRYVRERDIVVVRDYYRPYYRPVPRGVRANYYRGGYLPVGWRTRVVPVPVYLRTAVRASALRLSSRLHRRPRGGPQLERLHPRHRRGVLSTTA